ncbi:MAG: hypothetical protein M1436_07040 [Acidobacteria bacterium]|nr:hypothetical protein [Acidobacteriota bacterium]
MPEGETLSQLLDPLCTEALAVKVVVRLALTERLCAAGAEPLTVALNEREDGLTARVLELVPSSAAIVQAALAIRTANDNT